MAHWWEVVGEGVPKTNKQTYNKTNKSFNNGLYLINYRKSNKKFDFQTVQSIWPEPRVGLAVG